jgi:hypothetical protein
MKDLLYIVLGLAAAGVGAWRMWVYATGSAIAGRPNSQQLSDLIIAIVCILVAIVFVGLFLAGRVNKEEEIHITK